MIKVGRFNELEVVKFVDFGVYLAEHAQAVTKILLPRKYVPEDLELGDKIKVFIYLDSEDRLVATTEKPLAQVGEIKLLKCVDANKIGAFLDWGLEKDLFVPFKHQTYRMFKGEFYVVKVLFDDRSNRIIGSNCFNKILPCKVDDLTENQEVSMIVYGENEIGYKVIIDHKNLGMIFKNQIFQPVKLGDVLKGFVSKIRPDGKIDLVLQKSGFKNKLPEKDRVLEILKQSGGFLPITAKTTPAEIANIFGVSKRTYKQMIGMLYKERKVEIRDDGVKLL
jgi:predicted RNA-binding protein (virulence factor B family)